jgi:GalNAc-alpha-(1->4)-GalNAc-alpha-(1->3)-diNAcBac-PP-undecaprenol alpha-1,4-N-acetyl-D-galactosaminyltransferase
MRKISEKPKFLFVIDNLSTGGAQRQMVNLALGLSSRGYRVEVFCYTHGDLLAKPLIEAGILIHWHYKRSRFSLDVIFALRKLIYSGHFDVILSFLTTPNFYALLAGRFLKLNALPVIVSERFCDLPQGVDLVDRFTRQFYRIATYVVANSNHQRMNLLNKYPWLKNKISTIYNGYDLETFSPASAEPNNKPLKILAIASVSPYKNGLCLVEALNILHQRDGLNFSVDWIGQLVMMGDRLVYLNEMNQAIKKYGLDQQWQWLNQRSDIVDQLHQHDVLVHPSFGEGLPNVVCEALACARPVIVSNTLDHSQLVTDGENGFLFNCKDPQDLANKIKLFYNLSLDKRREMGLNGRKYAETHLSKKRLTDDYESLFLKCLNRVKN